jgi:transcriptional/translational regulatory protein YebC/TACO1
MKEYILFETVEDYEDALEFIMEEDVRDVVPNPDKLEIVINMFDLRLVEDILDSAAIPYKIWR